MISRLTQVEVDRGDGQMTQLDDAEIAGFLPCSEGPGPKRSPSWWATPPSSSIGIPSSTRRWSLIPGGPRRRRGDPALFPPLPVPGAVLRAGCHLQRRHRPGRAPTILVTGSATRDERFYDDPDTFDIDRPASLALGFGYGVHSCLGAALARMESRIAIEELALRWPRFEVDEASCLRVQMSNVAGYSSVPVHRVR